MRWTVEAHRTVSLVSRPCKRSFFLAGKPYASVAVPLTLTQLLLSLVDFSVSIPESRARAIHDSWPSDEKPTIRAIQDQYKVLKKEAATKGIKATRGFSSDRRTHIKPNTVDSVTPRAPSTPVKSSSAQIKTPTSSAKKRRRCESDNEQEDVEPSSSPSAVSNASDGSGDDVEASIPVSNGHKKTRTLPTRLVRSNARVYIDSDDSAAPAERVDIDDEDSDSDFMTESDRVRQNQTAGNPTDHDTDRTVGPHHHFGNDRSELRDPETAIKLENGHQTGHDMTGADQPASIPIEVSESRRSSWHTAFEKIPEDEIMEV